VRGISAEETCHHNSQSNGRHCNAICLLDHNGLAADWHHTAVGSRHGTVCLTYSERDTCKGSVRATIDDTYGEKKESSEEIVSPRYLDD